MEDRTQNFSRLEDAILGAEVERERLAAIVVPQVPQANAELEPHGAIWRYLQREDKFVLFTSLREDEVLDLYRHLEPYIAEHRRRGKQPKLSWEDHLLVILIWYKVYVRFLPFIQYVLT